MSQTNKIIFATISSLILAYFLMSCNSLKNAKYKVVEHNYSKEYYESLGSNINRLVEMRTGVFVQYLYVTANDSLVLWTVNDGADSTITIARKVGDPIKDGHWILTYTFMSHAPDVTLAATLEKYEVSPNSRDTIFCYFHKVPESIGWEEVSDEKYKFEELELKSYNDYKDVCITLARQDLMEYTGLTNFRKATHFTEKYTLRKDFYTVTPKESRFLVSFYEDENAEGNPYEAVQILLKMPLQNKFYPSLNSYDKKKD